MLPSLPLPTITATCSFFIYFLPSGTFTKSFGSCGGYIAGDSNLIRFIKRHGPAHLYASAISPPAAQQILSAIHLIDGKDGTTRGMDKVRNTRACLHRC